MSNKAVIIVCVIAIIICICILILTIGFNAENKYEYKRAIIRTAWDIVDKDVESYKNYGDVVRIVCKDKSEYLVSWYNVTMMNTSKDMKKENK